MTVLDFGREKWHTLSQISSLDSETARRRAIGLSDLLGKCPQRRGVKEAGERIKQGLELTWGSSPSRLIKGGALEHELHDRVGLSVSQRELMSGIPRWSV